MNATLAELNNGIASRSAKETFSIAEKLALALPPDITLCLQGPVGSGKTTFTAGIAKKLGADGVVTSPSYNLLAIHQTETRTILHLDAYRLNDNETLDALCLEDLQESPWLLIVEWPENIPQAIPTERWWITFEVTQANERMIRLVLPENFC